MPRTFLLRTIGGIVTNDLAQDRQESGTLHKRLSRVAPIISLVWFALDLIGDAEQRDVRLRWIAE